MDPVIMVLLSFFNILGCLIVGYLRLRLATNRKWLDTTIEVLGGVLWLWAIIFCIFCIVALGSHLAEFPNTL